MNKNFVEIILKTISYIVTLLLGIISASCFSSCQTSHSFTSEGSGTVIINDTSRLSHGSIIKYSRNGIKFY